MLYLALPFAAIILWLLYARLRRRIAEGAASEVERRFESTVRRFHVEIDRFKLTRQGAVKVVLNHDHAIWTHVEKLANEAPEDRESLRLRVHRYVEEIVPFFKPLAYYSFGFEIARRFLNLLYLVEIRGDLDRTRIISKQRPSSIIYLMNHRSNVDYVLAAYALAEKLALSFAVGEWARVWPLEYLFKSFGSFFIRRGFRDPLYHTVLRRYVQMITKAGVTQAIFPEGGLSRNGRLKPPKIGLIDSILCAKEDRSFDRELIFVPVAINYDRVLEDRALTRELRNKKPPGGRIKTAAQVFSLLFKNIYKFSRKRIRKNGIAAVSFGDPISFDEWMARRNVEIFSLEKEARREHVAEFCNHVFKKIASLVPVTPLCLVARILAEEGPITRDKLYSRADEEIARYKEKECEVIGSDRGAEWMVDGAILRFELRKIIRTDNGKIGINPDDMQIFEYYANSIRHHDDRMVPSVGRPKR